MHWVSRAPSIEGAATLPLVHGQGDCGSVPLQANGCWLEFVERQAHASGSMHTSGDMIVHVHPDDERHIEVLAQDLPCFSGAQFAVDITLRSALGSSGEPRLHQQRVSKDRQGNHVTQNWWRPHGAFSCGGHRDRREVDEEAVKARDASRFLAHQVALAWERRWTRMLSVACASSFAASLVEPMTRLVPDRW